VKPIGDETELGNNVRYQLIDLQAVGCVVLNVEDDVAFLGLLALLRGW